jgi:hypothetical protein
VVSVAASTLLATHVTPRPIPWIRFRRAAILRPRMCANPRRANFLAPNLANDVVQGKKSVKKARDAYGEAIMQMMQGNPPENTQKPLFETASATPAIQMSNYRSGPDIGYGGNSATEILREITTERQAVAYKLIRSCGLRR